ncbi:MAG: heme lyase CcmF/NrfE family subunit [Ktedonobacterales bacterium]
MQFALRFSDLGAIALLLALLFAVYAVVASALAGARSSAALATSGRRSVIVVAALLVTAALSLIFSFLTHDYGMAYVAEHSSQAMPWYYTLSAFYGGQEGSLLYWAMMLSIFSVIAVALHRRASSQLMPYVVATLMAIETFFLITLNFVSTPFTRTVIPPADGAGLNPILQDPGMLIHPPMLLMGYMSFSVPFAFAIAAMISNRLDSSWLRAIRRWMLVAWMIQTAGLILGAWWAYHVLGWGGYWGWDPVENAALLPWLTATAYLHSALVQERRGSLKVWNLGLVLATFALSIFGTFEVRSGIINSVHSFAYSDIGPYFLGFLAVALIASIGLFIYRLPQLKPDQEFDSVVSREGSFLVNNLLLTGIAFATFWGTVFPILSQAFRGQTMTVGATFYQQVNGPIFVGLIFMMGVGPLLAWRRASRSSVIRHFRWPALVGLVCAIVLPALGFVGVLPAIGIWPNVGFAVCAFTAATIFYEVGRGVRVRHGHGEAYPLALYKLVSRHRQRYGGYLVHLGLVALAVGVIGSQFFQTQRDGELHVGQSVAVSGYTITYKGLTDTSKDNIQTITTHFTVSHDGHFVEDIYPGQRIFPGFETQPTSSVSITTQPNLNDLYVFLAAYDETNPKDTVATIRVFINPMVSLVWSGGVLMLLGGILCWWPERRRVAPLGEKSGERAATTAKQSVKQSVAKAGVEVAV